MKASSNFTDKQNVEPKAYGSLPVSYGLPKIHKKMRLCKLLYFFFTVQVILLHCLYAIHDYFSLTQGFSKRFNCLKAIQFSRHVSFIPVC